MTTEKIANMLEVLVTKDYSKEDVLEFARQIVTSPEEVFKLYATKVDLESRAGKILNELGIPLEEKAYEYLIKSVRIAYNNPAILNKAALFGLYSEVAKEVNRVPADVRDNIAETIKYAWNEADRDVKVKYFGATSRHESIRGIDFIKMLASYLKSQE
ncbi:MAG: sporulation initiation factor Spo0A C-terminal domain-containing protein [Clostridia bacterium]|nr:sporulation initiation factor Spo0A C-terminal domain-containing protein [Clostridia bacterium]